MAAAESSLSRLGKGKEKGSGVKKEEEKPYIHTPPLPFAGRSAAGPSRCTPCREKGRGAFPNFPPPRLPDSLSKFCNDHLILFKRTIDTDRLEKLPPRYSRAVASSLRGACHICDTTERDFTSGAFPPPPFFFPFPSYAPSQQNKPFCRKHRPSRSQGNRGYGIGHRGQAGDSRGQSAGRGQVHSEGMQAVISRASSLRRRKVPGKNRY